MQCRRGPVKRLHRRCAGRELEESGKNGASARQRVDCFGRARRPPRATSSARYRPRAIFAAVPRRLRRGGAGGGGGGHVPGRGMDVSRVWVRSRFPRRDRAESRPAKKRSGVLWVMRVHRHAPQALGPGSEAMECMDGATCRRQASAGSWSGRRDLLVVTAAMMRQGRYAYQLGAEWPLVSSKLAATNASERLPMPLLAVSVRNCRSPSVANPGSSANARASTHR